MSYWSSPVSLAKFSVHRALNSTLARRSYKHCFHLYGQEFFWEVGIMGYQHRTSQRQWPCHCVFTCHAPHFWEVMYEQTTLGESGRLQLCRWLELTCAAVSSLYISERIYVSRINFHAHGGAKTSFTHCLITKENRIPIYELSKSEGKCLHSWFAVVLAGIKWHRIIKIWS